MLWNNPYEINKIISKLLIENNETLENVLNESIIVKKLKNSFNKELYNFFEDNKNAYFVFKYAENGNLFDYLKKKYIKEDEALSFIIKLLITLNYIHNKNIIHGDTLKLIINKFK